LTLWAGFLRARPDYLPIPFWFWNDVLDPREVRRQVREFHAKGIGGFFIHGRMGRITPYLGRRWMRCVREAVHEARRLGLQVWIYDEDNWPSGYGGGRVTRRAPGCVQRYLLGERIPLPKGSSPVPPGGPDDVVALFACSRAPSGEEAFQQLPVDPKAAGTPRRFGTAIDALLRFRLEEHTFRRYFCHEVFENGYVDVLDGKVAQTFLESVHKAYQREIGREFGGTVRGFFTDEPSYHDWDWSSSAWRLPWTDALPEEFEKEHGKPLLECLPQLVCPGDDSVRVRRDYHAALSRLFVNNYTRPISEWCHQRRLQLTGHYLLEESLAGTTETTGDPMQHYALQHLPGVDHLGNTLDLRASWSCPEILCKQVASVAHQLGKQRVLAELFAGAGWDFTIQDLKRIADWTAAMGVNLFCPHGMHYSLRGYRKRDYPPSLSYQQPWWGFCRPFNLHLARISYLLTRGTRVVNVLVLHPLESVWATHQPGTFPWAESSVERGLRTLSRSLVGAQMDSDFGNEAIMERKGRVKGPELRIGHGRYPVVIVPHSVTWRRSTLILLKRFVERGGTLLVVEPIPTHVDGVLSGEIKDLFRSARSLGHWEDPGFGDRVRRVVSRLTPPSVEVTAVSPFEPSSKPRGVKANGIVSMRGGKKWTVEIALRADGAPEEWDTLAGTRKPLPFRRTRGRCVINLEFDAGRSHLIVVRPGKSFRMRPTGDTNTRYALFARRRTVPCRLSSPNALILDRCRVRRKGAPPGELLPVITLADELRSRAEDRPLSIEYTFTSRVPVAAAELLMETPEEFTVRFNGQPVPFPERGSRYFLDRHFRRVRLPGGIGAGGNRLLVECRWHPGLEIEPCYILGDFGVAIDGEQPEIVSLPTTLGVGSWVEQGLPFYAGTVSYQFEVDVPGSGPMSARICTEAIRGAAEIRVNDAHAGYWLWPPFRVEIGRLLSAGRNRVTIHVAGTLRNFFGPHHLPGDELVDLFSPHHFRVPKGERAERYRLQPVGLLKPVFLEFESRGCLGNPRRQRRGG
jgi:hypothetical protein